MVFNKDISIKSNNIYYNLILLALLSLVISIYISSFFKGSFLFIGTTFLVFIFLVFMVSTDVILKIIFWTTFFMMIISHSYIQNNLFSIDNFVYKKHIYWLIDLTIIMLLLKLLINHYYKERTMKFVIILAVLLAMSVIVGSISIGQIVLGFRSNYIFIPLIFIIYIYEFREDQYHSYFNLFKNMAILSTILSLFSFLYYGIHFSGDLNGGIFGRSGTGVGVIFAVSQTILFLSIYVEKYRVKYLLYALISSAFMIFAKSYFGFPLLAITFLIFISQRFEIKKILQNVIIVFLLFISLIYLMNRYLPQDEVERYVNRMTNSDELINYETQYTFGRISSLTFGYNEIKKSTINLLFGYGISSISYRGETSGYSNIVFDTYNVKTINFSLMILYEFGLLGVILLIILFIKIYNLWKSTIIEDDKIRDIYNFKYIPFILIIFYLSIFYTAAFKVYFLIFYFAIHLSYLNYIRKNMLTKDRKYKTYEKKI